MIVINAMLVFLVEKKKKEECTRIKFSPRLQVFAQKQEKPRRRGGLL